MYSITLKEFNRILLCSILVCVVLFFGQKVIIPITFAAFFAMLFTPMSNLLEKHKFKRWLTALLSIIITLGIGTAIVLLVFFQGKDFAKEFPKMEEKSKKMIRDGEMYIAVKYNVPIEKQEEVITKQLKSLSESSGSFIKKSFMGIADFFAAFVLVIIFMFLFLFQREKYESFFLKLTKNTPTENTRKMLEEIIKVSQHYLRGRMISIVIFTICFTIGFLIVGLKNAFLLAFIAALLTIVPYIGSIIGGLFPFAVALVTEDSNNAAFGALAVILVVQGIDNYFIEPYIIGGAVNVSAFFTILILFIGGILWGVAGMILFIPMLGVFKIICDHVPALNPYGFLIGDQKEIKGESKFKKWFKKKFGGNEAANLRVS